MRKIIFSMLLASVAVSPALAQDRPDDGDRRARHEQRQQERAQQQAGQQQAQQQRQAMQQERQAAQQQAMQQQAAQRQQMRDQYRANRQMPVQQGQAAQPNPYRQRGDGLSRWNRDGVQQSGDPSRWTRDPAQRPGETGAWTRDRYQAQPGTSYQQRQAWQQQQQYAGRNRWANGGGWSRDWRNDRRYDWRRFRDTHRSVFRVGIYVDPFGYNYRRFDIGYRLMPAYYGQQFWFDPGMYGLPYPPPGTQWIRYWNDALLVDMYSGQVIDAIPNFFW